MEPFLVKILYDSDGNKIKHAKWCAVNPFGDGNRSLCKGDVFGFGESDVIFHATSTGKVTCPECIKQIKYYAKYNLK